MIVYGINPVIEALRAGRVRRLWVSGRRDERMQKLLAFAATQRVSAEQVPLEALARRAGGGVHQGVVADVDERDGYSVEELLQTAVGVPLLVVLDGIEDPHNLGAILRTADATGASGVVVQTRRSAARSGAAVKASAGAAAHVRVAEVVNIARALEELKSHDVWTVGLAADAPEAYDATDFTLATAVVLGAEGAGLRRLVRERCDQLVSIPMSGHVGSVNVSVAAGVVLFEAIRQRRGRPGPSEDGRDPGPG
jgi:23S rRNA (guanosine2251-2'-O)-methyltransferase